MFTNIIEVKMFQIYDFDKVEAFLENDISTFTFLVMFSESEKFRDGVRPNGFGDSHFDAVTKVIYEIYTKRVSLRLTRLDMFQLQFYF